MRMNRIWAGVILLATALAAVIVPEAAMAAPMLADLGHHLAPHGGHGLAMASMAAPVLLDPEQLKALKETVTNELTRINGDLDAKAVEMQKQLKETGDQAKELKTSVDQLLSEQKKYGDLEARLREIEQAGDRKKGGDAVLSVGRQLVAFDGLKGWSPQTSRDSLRVPVKNALYTSDLGGAGSEVIAPDRQLGVVRTLRQRLFVRDLIPAGRTGANTLYWVQQTGFVNNARVVTEGAKKPESTISFELKSTPVATIAHYFKVAKQVLDDFTGLQSIVDDELRYGLKYAEEQEFLFGDGTGVNLHGIVPQAETYAPSLSVTDRTRIDDIRDAFLQAQLARLPASGVVMHFTDWAEIETTKDSLGRYIIGNPQGQATPTLWGRPVVETEIAEFEGNFLTGGFQGGAMIMDREDANVVIATENEDDFVKNMLTVRAEERAGLQVKRPEAFIYGPFSS